MTFTITKCVEDYVSENYNVFRKRFIEMRLYLLNRLSKYDVFLLKTHLNEYYHIDRNNWTSQRKYLSKFNDILNDALNQPLGSYIILYHKDFFDEMLYTYCKTKKGDPSSTDASVLIDYINILTGRLGFHNP